MDLKELLRRYDYLKKYGIKELENEIQELENSKYDIQTIKFIERVQEGKKDNSRIENINLKIQELIFKLKKRKRFVYEVEDILNTIMQDQFNFLIDYYVNFNGRKSKFKLSKNLSEAKFKELHKEACKKVTKEINNILWFCSIKFEYL